MVKSRGEVLIAGKGSDIPAAELDCLGDCPDLA